ncbi:hypothetical protein EV1_035873 [Malus domestica]
MQPWWQGEEAAPSHDQQVSRYVSAAMAKEKVGYEWARFSSTEERLIEKFGLDLMQWDLRHGLSRTEEWNWLFGYRSDILRVVVWL